MPRRARWHHELQCVADLGAESVLAEEGHGTRRRGDADVVVTVVAGAGQAAKERARRHLAVVEDDAGDRGPPAVAQHDERSDPVDDPVDREVGATPSPSTAEFVTASTLGSRSQRALRRTRAVCRSDEARSA